MITITTVSYGDILPSSDSERIHDICAMILGCGYSGLLLGHMVSIISSKDPALSALESHSSSFARYLNVSKGVPVSAFKSNGPRVREGALVVDTQIFALTR